MFYKIHKTEILHTTSQELVGQSDGPLGGIASRIMAAELSEGDTLNPNAVRKAGVPRTPRLMIFFYDEWADAATHLSKGDVLQVSICLSCFAQYHGGLFNIY